MLHSHYASEKKTHGKKKTGKKIGEYRVLCGCVAGKKDNKNVIYCHKAPSIYTNIYHIIIIFLSSFCGTCVYGLTNVDDRSSVFRSISERAMCSGCMDK